MDAPNDKHGKNDNDEDDGVIEILIVQGWSRTSYESLIFNLVSSAAFGFIEKFNLYHMATQNDIISNQLRY